MVLQCLSYKSIEFKVIISPKMADPFESLPNEILCQIIQQIENIQELAHLRQTSSIINKVIPSYVKHLNANEKKFVPMSWVEGMIRLRSLGDNIVLSVKWRDLEILKSLTQLRKASFVIADFPTSNILEVLNALNLKHRLAEANFRIIMPSRSLNFIILKTRLLLSSDSSLFNAQIILQNYPELSLIPYGKVDASEGLIIYMKTNHGPRPIVCEYLAYNFKITVLLQLGIHVQGQEKVSILQMYEYFQRRHPENQWWRRLSTTELPLYYWWYRLNHSEVNLCNIIRYWMAQLNLLNPEFV